MPYFHCIARYATPTGGCSLRSFNVEAADLEEARGKASARLASRAARALDYNVTAYAPGYVPAGVRRRTPTA